MDIDEWFKIAAPKSKRRYAHLDLPTNLERSRNYVTNPDKISHHGFYPFILLFGMTKSLLSLVQALRRNILKPGKYVMWRTLIDVFTSTTVSFWVKSMKNIWLRMV